MPERLLTYDNLGSLEDIVFLMQHVLSSHSPKKVKDIREYCTSQSINYSYSLLGALELLETLSLVEKQNRDSLVLTPAGSALQQKCSSRVQFSRRLIELLFASLNERNLLESFLSLDHIKYDINLDALTLRNSQIPLKYSGIRNLLIQLGFLHPHKTSPNLLIVDQTFSEFFEYTVLGWLRADVTRHMSSVSLSLEHLKQIQNLKESIGREAEEYVEVYERCRLKDHLQKQRIKIISHIDTGAGYDIVSFNSCESVMLDRFVEVKSFSRDVTFYWSRNEIATAELKGENYFLYLVDRSRMSETSYQPLIIQNPFKQVFLGDNWRKEEIIWYISRP